MNFKRVLNRPAIVVAVIVAIISTAILTNNYHPDIPTKEGATFHGYVELPPAPISPQMSDGILPPQSITKGMFDDLLPPPDTAKGAFDDLIPPPPNPIWKKLIFASVCIISVFLIVYLAIMGSYFMVRSQAMGKISTWAGQMRGEITLKIIGYSLAVLILCATFLFFGYWTYHNMRYKVLLVQGLRPILYDSWTNKGTVIPLESEPKTR